MISADPSARRTRPPVEHRLLGLDRRTFALPLVVIGIFVLWTFVSPAIDRGLDYDDPVRAGDVLVLGPSATLSPPVGWNVESGIRGSDAVRAPNEKGARILVDGDGIVVSTQTGPFAGNASAFVAQVADLDERLGADSAFTVEGSQRSLTIDGRRGIAQEFKTIAGEGAVFGVVENGVGYAVVATGTTDALNRAATTLGTMIASIDLDAQTAGS